MREIEFNRTDALHPFKNSIYNSSGYSNSFRPYSGYFKFIYEYLQEFILRAYSFKIDIDTFPPLGLFFL